MFHEKVQLRKIDSASEEEYEVFFDPQIDGDDFDLPPTSPIFPSYSNEQQRADLAENLAYSWLSLIKNNCFLTGTPIQKKDMSMTMVRNEFERVFAEFNDKNRIERFQVMIHNAIATACEHVLEATELYKWLMSGYTRESFNTQKNNLDGIDAPPLDHTLLGNDHTQNENERGINALTKIRQAVELLGNLTVIDTIDLELDDDDIKLINRLCRRFTGH